MKFHINKKGIPAICKAKDGNCPLGGDNLHFDTVKEAENFAKQEQIEKHGLLPSRPLIEKGNYMTKESIMNRLNEHYKIAQIQGKGEAFGVFLQGSQNYIDNLFFENSDVDSRAIYIPEIREICLNRDISMPEYIMENTEHIDRFDIRKFLTLIKTPGINNYENLFTEYVIIKPSYQKFYDEIVGMREDLVRINEKKFVMATMGLSLRDFKDIERRVGGEDYDIETFGYSRKRLSNIIRFNMTTKAYIAGKPFSECLKSMPQELIHKIRRTEMYTHEEAMKIAKTHDEETYALAYDFNKFKSWEDIHKVLDKLDDIFVEIMMYGK